MSKTLLGLYFLSTIALGIAPKTYDVPHLKCSSKEQADFDKSPCRKAYYTELFRMQCQSIADHYVQGDYRVNCYDNYHHYNAQAFREHYKKEKIAKGKRRKEVRIGGFNMLHPTNGRTMFKDLHLLSKIIDKEFDLLAGLELISNTAKDLQHNNRLNAYIKYYSEVLKTREMTAKQRAKIESGLKRAKSSLIVPGYAKILRRLRKLDPSWALIMSSRGESLRVNGQKEFVGYYYRARMVRPMPNKFCSQELSKVRANSKMGKLAACTPWFNKRINKAFSRRPFIADFESGAFRTTMVASHVIFKSPPKDEGNRMAEVMMPAFQVNSYEEFPRGEGIDGSNYARWAEVKLTLDLMQDMRKNHGIKNIIYVADFNLESKEHLWRHVLKSFPGGKIYIEGPTSLSLTHGPSSNYDHFIFNPSQTTRCVGEDGHVDANRIDFFTTDYITDKIAENGYTDSLWKRFIARLKGRQQTSGITVHKSLPYRYVIEEEPLLEAYPLKKDEHLKNFDQKIVNPAPSIDTIYNRHVNALSDHFPVSLSCRVN